MGIQYSRIGLLGAICLAGGGAGCLLPDYTEAEGVCQQGTPWVRKIGGEFIDVAGSAASDPCGGVTIGGGIQATVKFGPEATLEAENKALDGFVARFDALGNTLWATHFGSSGQQIISHVETDIFGSAAAAGLFIGTLAPSTGETFTGEGDPNAPGPAMPGDKDDREYSTFVSKLDLYGAHLWTRAFRGTADNESTTPCGVAADREGRVTIAGNFKGSVTIEGVTLMGQGDSSIFMAHYDAAGGLIWKKYFSTVGGVDCYAFTADKDGNLLMSGAYGSAIDFGAGPLPAPIAGGQKLFVLKITPDGTPAWSDASPSGDLQFGTAITSDAQGNVFVAGSFIGDVNLGDADIKSKGFPDIFVQKRNAAGEPQWGRVFSSANNGKNSASVATIRIDPSGDVLFGGSLVGDLMLDQQIVAFAEDPPPIIATGDAFLARLRGSDGEPTASRIFRNPGSQSLTGLAVDLEGWPIIVSWFPKSIDLGPGPGVLEAEDFGWGTIFAAKLKL
jgi:hypothetical protein